MDTKAILNIIKITIVLQIIAATLAFANEAVDNSSSKVSYTNTRTVRLRDKHLRNPVNVKKGSRISLDPEFLKKVFGTTTPTAEQIQQLMLNPEEASHGKVVTQSFKDTNTGQYKYDYFFPVIVVDEIGKMLKGQMALQAYFRSEFVELDGLTIADDNSRVAYQSPQTSDRVRSLIKQNRRVTEAAATDYCTTCSNNPRSGNIQDLSNLKDVINTATTSTSTHELWIKFNDFAREFASNNKHISKSNAGRYKRLYIKSLIEKFGAKDAGIILTALTGYMESPHRQNIDVQIAEIAAVIKVIENRAQNRYKTKSKTLRDIGASQDLDARLSAILADWQFSAWNDKDNSLPRMLNYNPDTADTTTKRKLAMAFEAQKLMNEGNIEFIGKMNDSHLQHYHANYVSPSWSNSRKRVEPKVKVNGVEIDLSKQRGAKHVFYAEIS